MRQPGAWPAFLTTFKPMLKRARGTPHYADVRKLLELWLHAKKLQRLVDGQNAKLYEVARERDRGLMVLAETRRDSLSVHVAYHKLCVWADTERWATECPNTGGPSVTTTGVTCHG